MEFAVTLLQRMGLYAPKPATHEAFDLRLTRITTRESRRNARTRVFVRPAL
jgi:hypothetical protein